jgi:hypothetical protein
LPADLYAPPLPGYDAHADRLVDASRAAMGLLVDTLPKHVEGTRRARTLAPQATDWAKRHPLDASAARAVVAMLTWSRIHGFVSLETAGNYASMGVDPDALFEIELSALAR